MRLNPFKKKKKKRSRSSSPVERDSWLSSQAKKAVAGILLLVFSLIAILSFFNAAGPTGEFILNLLRRIFGWLAYLAPLALIMLGLHLVWPRRVALERLRVIGLLLVGIGLLGLVHIMGASTDDALQAAYEGRAGGYLGFLFSFPLAQALSRVAATLIFLGTFMIGLILTFRVSPIDVWEWIRGAFVSGGESDAAADEDEQVTVEERPRFKVGMVSQVLADANETGGNDSTEGDHHVQQKRAVQQVKARNRRYRPDVLKLLSSSSSTMARNKDYEDKMKETIQQTLENFGINVEMREAHVGPTVTQYTLRPEQGTKLSRITSLQNDLALELAAHPIRIEAPIPNKDLVGIEIPNKSPSLVRLRELLMSKEMKESDSPLSFALGKDVSGKVIVDTLERLPHLLIAGATGSGKSVCIHALLLSWLYRNSPDVLRFIMIDPKRVELAAYNGIPHLMSPVIVDTEKTMLALKWALNEMDLRYRLLEDSGARNLLSFNLNNPSEAKPFIVIVIDELADLMVKHAREIEGPIVRLSQMARAVGIHLVLATQRPSVNVLTGLIKANVPARIAFSVASQVDSRTILDMSGAEKLVGNGEWLYMAGDNARPVRIQGGFVSEEEVRRVVEEVKLTGEADYEDEIVSQPHKSIGGGGLQGVDDDSLLEEAKRVVVRDKKASASLLQRRLRIGYARAARMLDVLEEAGVIGAAEGNKPRAVLIDGVDENEEEVQYEKKQDVTDKPRLEEKTVIVEEDNSLFSDNQEDSGDKNKYEERKQW